MFCSVEKIVELHPEEDQALIVLLVDIFTIHGSVLSEPTEEMKQRPNVTAKIDAQLIQPCVSLGDGKVQPLTSIRSMPRPVQQTESGQWTSTKFNLAPQTTGPGNFATTEWIYATHGGTCPLGYNAVTALIMPRPIGWISTYRKNGRIPHIAPYSFFSDVARCGGSQTTTGTTPPMVAFSAYRRNNGTTPKDAEQDAIDTGYFAVNMVTESLAVPMNLSAAEIAADDSEFALSGLSFESAQCIEAPVVTQSPIRYECQYIRSVPIGSFSIVIGQVVGIAIDSSIIDSTSGLIDPTQVKPITRLGFMDEYGTTIH
jgi:flavin reductase (DIM6/NTAB) family NADH-FMN oxidoreductase RutF